MWRMTSVPGRGFQALSIGSLVGVNKKKENNVSSPILVIQSNPVEFCGSQEKE